MNIIDIAIVFIILLFGIAGLKKGLIKEAISLLGMIIILVIAFLLKGNIGNVLCKYLPFFDFGGTFKGITSLNILIYQFIGFFVIYSLLLGIYGIVMKLTGLVQKLVNMTVILLIPSKIGGFLLGLIEGAIICFVGLLVLMIPLQNNELFSSSKLTHKIIYNTPVISKASQNITKSVTEVYDLGDRMIAGEITSDEANLKTISIMLKYKVVTPKTIEQLIILDKLKDIEGLDALLSTYK